MVIEKYLTNKNEVSKLFVFYSKNDLLLPYLKLLLNSYESNSDVVITYSELKTKFRKKQKAITVYVYGSSMFKEHKKTIQIIENLISKSFNANIEDEPSISKLIKIKNELDFIK